MTSHMPTAARSIRFMDSIGSLAIVYLSSSLSWLPVNIFIAANIVKGERRDK